jgi:hypothetical protein
MEGPRAPTEKELPHVLEFLNSNLRPDSTWSIANEYPTALSPSNIGNIRVITEGNVVLSHAVLKPLIIKTPAMIFKVAAIGSVVTDNQQRGQGLSHRILKECLLEAERQDCDIAVLWTNLYDFYRKLDFELAGYEASVVLDNEFSVPTQNLKFIKGTQVSPEALQRLYSQHTVASVRSAEETRKFLQIPNTCLYTAWDAQGQLAAYAVEGKGADLTGYIHEWGGPVSKLLALFSWIRKEKGTSITIICGQHSVNLLSALKAIPGALYNEGYLGMVKLVKEDLLFGKVKRAARSIGIPDLILEKIGDNYRLGVGADVVEFTDQKDMVRVLLGPLPEIPHLKPETVKTLERILPAQLWIWGWDSI